jgi:hypothetical protein
MDGFAFCAVPRDTLGSNYSDCLTTPRRPLSWLEKGKPKLER